MDGKRSGRLGHDAFILGVSTPPGITALHRGQGRAKGGQREGKIKTRRYFIWNKTYENDRQRLNGNSVLIGFLEKIRWHRIIQNLGQLCCSKLLRLLKDFPQNWGDWG